MRKTFFRSFLSKNLKRFIFNGSKNFFIIFDIHLKKVVIPERMINAYYNKENLDDLFFNK